MTSVAALAKSTLKELRAKRDLLDRSISCVEAMIEAMKPQKQQKVAHKKKRGWSKAARQAQSERVKARLAANRNPFGQRTPEEVLAGEPARV